MVAYPLPNFPGRTQENLLGLLLRKKLEPNVEDWVVEGREIVAKAAGPEGGSGLQQEEMLDLWRWAGMAANEQARQHTWGGNYTLEEKEAGVENVVTGLRRKLKENPDDSSDEDDDESMDEDPDGDEMEIVGVRRKSEAGGVDFEVRKSSEHKVPEEVPNALPINNIFRFMMTGVNH